MHLTNSFNPVGELMDLGAALTFLSNAQEAKEEYGLSKLLHDLGKEVNEIAYRMQDEEWEAPGAEELKARRMRERESRPPLDMSLKSDKEIISMLQELFTGNSNSSKNIREMIGLAHFYLNKNEQD